ncbi:hypothetical protein TWF173_000974 [Orbilia oligospora]|nr:hypothetical protein TWF173_000974 [Orbilia oligospora]
MARRKNRGCCFGLFDCFSFLFRKPPVGGEKLLDHPEIIAGILSHLPPKDLLKDIRLVHPVFYDIATTSSHPIVQWKTWMYAHPDIPRGLDYSRMYTPNVGHEFAYNPPRPSREISMMLLPIINKLWLRIIEDVKRAHDELGFKPGKEKDYTPLLENGNYSGLDDLVGDPPHDVDWYIEKQLLVDMPHTISQMQVTRPALTEAVNISMSVHCAVAMEVSGVADEIGEGRVWYDYVGGKQVGEEGRGMFNILSLSLLADGGGKTWGRGGEFQNKQQTV